MEGGVKASEVVVEFEIGVGHRAGGREAFHVVEASDGKEQYLARVQVDHQDSGARHGGEAFEIDVFGVDLGVAVEVVGGQVHFIGGDDAHAFGSKNLGHDIVGQIMVERGEGSLGAKPQKARLGFLARVEIFGNGAGFFPKVAQRFFVAPAVVGGHVKIVAGAGFDFLNELGELHCFFVGVGVDFKFGIGFAPGLNFDVAASKIALEAVKRPGGKGRPVLHHAGDEDGFVQSVVFVEEFMGGELVSALDNAMGCRAFCRARKCFKNPFALVKLGLKPFGSCEDGALHDVAERMGGRINCDPVLLHDKKQGCGFVSKHEVFRDPRSPRVVKFGDGGVDGGLVHDFSNGGIFRDSSRNSG